MVRLTLFGPPAALVDARSLALPFERRSQLVVHLALRGDWVGRAELAALLWPAQPSGQALANLRKTLFRLPALPGAPALEVEGHALRLRAATDVAEFEAALRDGRPQDAAAHAGERPLAGFDDDANEAWSTWLRFERDRLRTAWRGAVLACLAVPPPPAEAVALSARLLEADPLDEAALRFQLDGLVRAGQAPRARAAYEAFAQRLHDELGIAPGAELQAAARAIAAPGASTAVAAPPPPAAAVEDAGFVGRVVELRRIEAMLMQEGCRLLCLLGPGGVGKTRLARHALQQLAPRHADGGVFVPLEDAESVDDVVARLALQLGLGSVRPGAALAAVVEHLRTQQRLLVLDNFEQVAAEAAVLDRLLRECPQLRIVVTSRVRPAAEAIWLLPVDGLPCPEPEDADHLESFDAVRLFVQAAARVGAAVVPAAEAMAIVDICRRLDGHPLALELAAAWTRVLSCAAIAAEVAQDVDILHAPDATRPARHAGIGEVFERSWRLLSASERDALARLAAFRGGFTAEAARAAVGVALPLVGALVDKSLVGRDGARLQLHPLVQQYAGAKLAAADPAHAVAAAHAAHFLDWLHRLTGPAQRGDREALRAIDAELENARQAWRFAVAHGPGDALQRALPALMHHVEHRARFEDGLALLREALDAPVAQADAVLAAYLRSQEALVLERLARYAQAEAAARDALAGARRARHRPTRFQALAVLAGCALTVGRLPRATRLYRQALQIARADARVIDIAATIENLSLAEKRAGRYEQALALTLEALAQHRRNGDGAREALCRSNLASLYMFMHDDDEAAVHLHAALALAEHHGLVSTRAFVLANLTELATRAGDTASARRHAEQALELAGPAGLRPLAGWLRVQLARALAREGDLALARAELAAACELALALGTPSVKAAALLGLAELLDAQGQHGPARHVLALGVDEPALSEPDRDELRAEWARRAGADPAGGAPFGWTLDGLLGRVVSERDLAHGPLVAALRSGG